MQLESDARERSGMSGIVSRRGALAAGLSVAALGFGLHYVVAPKGEPDFRPLVTAIGELLIPTTDTPGAGAPEVADFVLLACRHGTLGGALSDLATVKRALDGRAGQAFLAAPSARKAEVLGGLDRDGFAARSAEGAAWLNVKRLILAGYYTSETGASKELRYELIPGRYDPDVPVTPQLRALSNDWTGLSIRNGGPN